MARSSEPSRPGLRIDSTTRPYGHRTVTGRIRRASHRAWRREAMMTTSRIIPEAPSLATSRTGSSSGPFLTSLACHSRNLSSLLNLSILPIPPPFSPITLALLITMLPSCNDVPNLRSISLPSISYNQWTISFLLSIVVGNLFLLLCKTLKSRPTTITDLDRMLYFI